MNWYCNPINVPYRYSFKADPRDLGKITVNREAADPSMVYYRGRYWIFPSMTAALWASDDLAHWESHPLAPNLPAYDYAPDVRVVGEWLYFTASNRGVPCDFYRTKDPIQGPWERIPGALTYWDPNLFADDDGRLYFYWGSSNSVPVRGVELDPETMHPIGELVDLLRGDPWTRGYERFGEDHCLTPKTPEETEQRFQEHLRRLGEQAADMTAERLEVLKATFADLPYIEGPWLTKHNGRYYLQYGCPGTEFNIYGDGCYVGDSPLGPFTPARNNPYSYRPGGYFPGAGHGSTMEDAAGSWWHASTMRISVCHLFERRVGLWPAGFDGDGELFCNQRYGDWPVAVEDVQRDPWADPKWMLLSYRKSVSASSYREGREPALAADENVQTWWRAAEGDPTPWLCLDLGEAMEIHAVQINFADEPDMDVPCPGEFVQTPDMLRYIDTAVRPTRWLLETSLDGDTWTVLEDKRAADTDLPHDLIVRESGFLARYVRLTVYAVPYGVSPCISGLRVFGLGDGPLPKPAAYTAQRIGGLDFTVSLPEAADRTGCCILWGHAPDKLYHSCLVMGGEAKEQRIGALVQGEQYWVRVDTFNENGITAGETRRLLSERTD